MEAFPWAIVIIGGPVLLAVAIIGAKLRNRSANRAIDPNTPDDDPSKGVPGHQ